MKYYLELQTHGSRTLETYLKNKTLLEKGALMWFLTNTWDQEWSVCGNIIISPYPNTHKENKLSIPKMICYKQ